MLTKVYLEGAMGRNFGREWTLDIHTPAEALQLIKANKPSIAGWVRDNSKRYEKCMIICKYADGRIEALNEKTMLMHKEPQEIHFIPIVEGAGKWMGAIVGAIMIVIGVILCCVPGGQVFGASLSSYGASFIVAGAGLLISSIVTAIMGRTKANKAQEEGNSFYFNGAQNTTKQGAPIPLIFGRCKVGSCVISSSVSVEDTNGQTRDYEPGVVEVVRDRI